MSPHDGSLDVQNATTAAISIAVPAAPMTAQRRTVSRDSRSILIRSIPL